MADTQTLPLKEPVKQVVGKPDTTNDTTVIVKKTYNTITEMSADFEFFTPVVIACCSRFDRDAVVEYNNLHPAAPDEQPVILDMAFIIFNDSRMISQRSNVDWRRRLYAIPKHRWEECRDFISGIMISDKDYLARLCYYTLPVVDTAQLKLGASAGVIVPVTVFGVSATNGFYYINANGLLQRDPALPDLCIKDVKVNSDE